MEGTKLFNMFPHVKLARIAGIDIGFHYSWLIIAALITISFVSEFHAVNPEWSSSTVWIAAIVTGLVFFASIVIHELGHAAVAKARGLPVRSITLFALGGVASIEKDAGDPATEFWMGIAGPLTSAALGFVFAALAGVAPWDGVTAAADPWTTALVWLSTMNFVLAVFNLVPGFPLDGGRVLRAAMWWLSGDPDQATRFASRVGQAVGLLLIGFGIWQFVAIGGFGSLWLALIGWFLLDAATTSYAGVDLMSGLRGLRVRDIMSEDCLRVDGRSTLQHFADAYVLGTAGRCFVVEQDGTVMGLVTPSDLARVDRSDWGRMTVNQVTRHFSTLRSVTPDTPVIDALRAMGREDVNQVAVMSDGRLEGILSRSRVLQLLEARAELSM